MVKKRDNKWKYWILTISYCHWKLPESVETLSNVKYIRGQLEVSKSQYLHWQIAVQYYEPTSFSFVTEQFAQKAHVEPIYSLEAWDYVWKEKTACKGTRFEFGDDSDLVNAIAKRNVESELNPSVVKSRQTLDINDLEKRLKRITESLYFLQHESLEILRNAVEDAEMIDLIDSIDLEDYYNVFDTESQSIEESHGLLTPPKKADFKSPKNHGKKWEVQDIEELEKLLKQEFVTLDEIAERFARTKKSIEMKAAELVNRLIKVGVIPEKAIQFYGGKVSMEMLNGYNEFKTNSNRDRKRRRE